MHPRAVGLAGYVVHVVDGARVERQWAAVSARLERRAARRPLPALFAVAAAGALAFVLLFALRPRAVAVSASLEGAVLETPEGAAGPKLALTEGSSLTLGSGSRVRLAALRPERVEVVLERGAVESEVERHEGRTWLVRAGGVSVEVKGTRFRVELRGAGDEQEVGVTVSRGRVEVVRAGAPEDVKRLAAGETWSGRVAGANAAAPTVPEPDPPLEEPAGSLRAPSLPGADETPPVAPEPALPLAPAAPAAPSAPESAGERAARAPAFEELARARRYAEAFALVKGARFHEETTASSPARLLLLGQAARATGHHREAALAYDSLRKRYRGDGLAGLAAFELGRLRLDAFGDRAGAAEALGDAIALAPGAAWREDAEARRVQALDGGSPSAACLAARDAYLARYPGGAHAVVVRTRCGGR